MISRDSAHNWILGLLLVVVTGATVQADWNDRFVAALRDRQLWSLGEAFCKEQMQAAKSPREAARWSVEGMRTAAAAALHQTGAAADDAWKVVGHWSDEFGGRFGDSSWGWQVELQWALAELAHGEALRMEAEVAADPKEIRVRSLGVLRSGERRLRTLERKLSGPPPNQSDPEQAMPPAVVQTLENQMVLAQARIFTSRAVSYEKGSDDRLAAFELASQALDELVQQTRPEDPVQWEALLLRSSGLRELGDYQQAKKTLDSIDDQFGLSPRIQLERDAQQLHLALDQEKKSLPIKPRIGRVIEGVAAPLWDLASLRALLEQLAQAKGSTSQQLLRQIEQGITGIESLHGPYWGRRATQMMVRQTSGVTGVASARLLEKTAQELLGQQRWQDAAALLIKAADAAEQSQDPSESFRLAYQAGLLFQENKEHQIAAKTLRDVALKWRKDDRSSQSHLLAVWNLAQASGKKLAEDPTYLIWLDEQINLWPKSPATARAQMWLGAWLERGGRSNEALDVYRRINPDLEPGRESVARIRTIWSQRLDRADESMTEKELQALTESLVPLLPDPQAAGVSIGRYQVALTWWELSSRLGRDLTNDDLAQLKQWTTKETVRLEDRIHARLVAAILTADDSVTPVAAADEWKHVPSWLIRWVVKYSRAESQRGSPAGTEQSRRIATWIQAWLKINSKVSESERVFLELAIGESFVEAGDRNTARRKLSDLATRHPRRLDVQRGWAHFLLSSDQQSDWQKAEKQWRRLTVLTRPGSSAWYEAKLGVAQAMFVQGNRQACAERLRYLKATRGFGNPPWSEKLETLLQQSN
jgi:TolA-binding protein